MCMMVYIAANEPLELIEWVEDSLFCVTELSKDELRVRKQFSKPFVYYAGSYEGCSCGFSYGENPIEDEDDERQDAAGRESVRLLSEVTFASSTKVVKITFILHLGSFLSSFRQRSKDLCGARPILSRRHRTS